MWTLFFEAVGAAGLLVFMVWWTVSGRSPNEPLEDAEDATRPEP